MSFSSADFQGGYRGDERKSQPEDAENHLVQSLGEENDQKDAMSALSQERGGDDTFEHPAKTPAFPWRCRMSDLDLAAFNHNRHNHHIPPGCAVQKWPFLQDSNDVLAMLPLDRLKMVLPPVGLLFPNLALRGIGSGC